MDLENKLIKIIKGFSDSGEFSMDTPLAEMGIDSLKTMELLMTIEDVFEVEIEESLLTPENFRNPNSVLQMLKGMAK